MVGPTRLSTRAALSAGSVTGVGGARYRKRIGTENGRLG